MLLVRYSAASSGAHHAQEAFLLFPLGRLIAQRWKQCKVDTVLGVLPVCLHRKAALASRWGALACCLWPVRGLPCYRSCVGDGDGGTRAALLLHEQWMRQVVDLTEVPVKSR